MKAESADEPTNPSPTIQLERNRSDLAPDRTDDEGNPTSAKSMETAELKEFDPLVDCQVDTTKACLKPTTGSTSLDAGSSDTSENLPDQYIGSLDIQETGNPERQARTRRFNREFGYETRDQSFEESRMCNKLGSRSSLVVDAQL